MALDLTAIAATGRATVEQLIDTSGTTVTITRDTVVQVTNPDTLQATEGTVTAVTGSLPAIITATSGGPAGDVLPGVQRRDVPWAIIVKAAVTRVRPGDVVTVTRSVDRALIGHRYRVVADQSGSAAVARILSATAIPRAGGRP